MNIYEKLQQCRVDLQKLNLKKSGHNDFAKFDYFELADFLPTVNEMFNKIKLHSKFEIVDRIAVLTIINTEKPDEIETFQSHIEDSSIKGCTPIQALGGIHTYMKRYLYVNALEITDGDIFEAATKNPALEKPTGAVAKREQDIVKILGNSQYTLSHVTSSALKKYGTGNLDELTDAQYFELKSNIEKAVKGQQQ